MPGIAADQPAITWWHILYLLQSQSLVRLWRREVLPGTWHALVPTSTEVGRYEDMKRLIPATFFYFYCPASEVEDCRRRIISRGHAQTSVCVWSARQLSGCRWSMHLPMRVSTRLSSRKCSVSSRTTGATVALTCAYSCPAITWWRSYNTVCSAACGEEVNNCRYFHTHVQFVVNMLIRRKNCCQNRCFWAN